MVLLRNGFGNNWKIKVIYQYHQFNSNREKTFWNKLIDPPPIQPEAYIIWGRIWIIKAGIQRGKKKSVF